MEVPGGTAVPDRTCDVCGGRTPASFRFCGACGHRLAGARPRSRGSDRRPPDVEDVEDVEAVAHGRDTEVVDTEVGVEERTARPAVAASAHAPAPPPRPGGRARTPVLTEQRVRRLLALVVAAMVVLTVVGVSQRSPEEPATLAAAGRGDAARTGTYASSRPGALASVAWQDVWTSSPPASAQQLRPPIAIGAGYLLEADGVLALVDRVDGRMRWRSELDVSGAPDPLPIDERLVVVAGAAEVSLVDGADGTRLWRTELADLGVVTALAVDGRTLAVGGSNGRVALVDLARGARRVEVTGRDLVGGRGPFTVDAITAVAGRFVATVRRPAEPDGSGQLAAVGPDGRVAWTSTEPVDAFRPVLAGEDVAIATGIGIGIVAVDVEQGEVRWRWRPAADEAAAGLHTVATSPDGATVLLSSASGVRRVLSARSGALVVSENGAPFSPDVGQVDPTGRVAVVTTAGRVEIVDVRTGRTELTGPPTGTSVVAPVVDGEQLVIGLAGAEVTAQPLGAAGSTWTTALTPAAACPVLAGARTVVLSGDRVRLHDAASGVRRWVTTPGLDLVGELAAGDDAVLGVSTGGLLTAWDGDDGIVRWAASAGGQPLGTPVVSGDAVVVAGGTGVGLGGGSRSGYVRSLALGDGARGWFTNTIAPVAHPPSVAEDRVVVATTTGELEALDLATGEERWRTELGAVATATPAQSGDAIVVVGEDGELVTFVDGPDGPERVAATSFPFALRRAPAVVDGSILLRADSHTLVSLDLRSHRIRWQASVPGDVLTTPPTVVGDQVVVGGQLGLHRFELTGGVELPTSEVGAVVGTVGATADGVVVCRADGELLVLR